MSEERGLITDQLSNIIEVIQLGRKTGQLIVERGEGTRLEKGEIIFMRGQITQARCNQRSGQEALNQLNRWGVCRYMFTPTSIIPGTATGPLGPLTLPSLQALRDTSPQLHALSPTQSTSNTNAFQQTDVHQVIGASIPVRTVSGDKALRLLDQAGLSRSHFRLFLLIDGKRSINELIRLAGKNYEDVHKLLRDLASIGLIYMDRQ
jgi:hypothetical protein